MQPGPCTRLVDPNCSGYSFCSCDDTGPEECPTCGQWDIDCTCHHYEDCE